MLELPSFDEVDDMYIMPSTPLICCSSGVVTVSATTWALAPGYWAVTTTCGGVMSGNCETGSRKYEMPPASTMITAIAEAKMGRWMKKPIMAGTSPRAGGPAPRRRRAHRRNMPRPPHRPW